MQQDPRLGKVRRLGKELRANVVTNTTPAMRIANEILGLTDEDGDTKFLDELRRDPELRDIYTLALLSCQPIHLENHAQRAVEFNTTPDTAKAYFDALYYAYLLGTNNTSSGRLLQRGPYEKTADKLAFLGKPEMAIEAAVLLLQPELATYDERTLRDFCWAGELAQKTGLIRDSFFGHTGFIQRHPNGPGYNLLNVGPTIHDLWINEAYQACSRIKTSITEPNTSRTLLSILREKPVHRFFGSSFIADMIKSHPQDFGELGAYTLDQYSEHKRHAKKVA
ncbi:MAG: hypothetical protein WC796_03720 [Candidatus Pacearchaeota archaeon]|jgi:hypothetical protein